MAQEDHTPFGASADEPSQPLERRPWLRRSIERGRRLVSQVPRQHRELVLHDPGALACDLRRSLWPLFLYAQERELADGR
jgi:hypothetical protein